MANVTKETPYYLGNDVSKGYGDFIMLDAQSDVVITGFQLDDTFEGHNRLHQVLSDFTRRHPNARIYAAVESTGGYENNWYQAMCGFQGSLNIQVARLNPLGVTANSRAELQRNRTDQISARDIAEYLIAHPKKVVYQHENPLASLRKQWSFIRLLIKQRTQLFNQLESLMYSACPELLPYCKHGVPQWVLKILHRYPTSARLARTRSSSLARIPYVNPKKATELIAAAKKGVASATGEVTERVIKATVSQIQALSQTIMEQSHLLFESCDVPQLKILKSFIGISDTSAIGLWLEIQLISRFATPKQLAAYFGLHPVYKQSGDGAWYYRMSKQGRTEPRRILFMVALNAIRNNPLIKETYEKHVLAGMKKMAAIGLCMHKILRILFGMLKNNTEFDPDIDRQNQQKSKPKNITPVTDQKRRFQSHDVTAPISRRQSQKRTEGPLEATDKKTPMPVKKINSDDSRTTSNECSESTHAPAQDNNDPNSKNDSIEQKIQGCLEQKPLIFKDQNASVKNNAMEKIWQILA